MNSFKDFGIEFDVYSRTSDAIHHQTAQAFFLELYKKGIFKALETEQFFDEEAKQFLADRYIIGTCPKCGNPNAYGDQCEKCGSTLSPTELIQPKSTLSGAIPVLKKTINWFLPMDELQNSEIFQQYIQNINNWKVNVKGQVSSWLNQQLQARSMTRDLDWGVKVPIPGAEGKVLYVWFDAPIGYISATKAFFEEKGNSTEWEKYWKSSDTKLVHFIGKDNIVFHTIIFPMILQAHGGFINPSDVPANEFLNLEGDKISTSRNWAVWINEYLEEFPNKQDELRYVLTANMPETKDNDFIWKYDGTPNTTDSYQARVNNELVAILGNFVNRVMVLTHKYYKGIIPQKTNDTTFDSLIQQYTESIHLSTDEMYRSIEEYRFRDALTNFIQIARHGNKFLAETEPWKLYKTSPEKVINAMLFALNISAFIGSLCEIMLPFTAKKIQAQLNIEGNGFQKKFNNDYLIARHAINEAKLLFANVENETMDRQVEKLNQSKALHQQATKQVVSPQKEAITFDQFQVCDIRVGTIVEAQKVPKTAKLLQLKIDTGIDVRTIISGIAEFYNPEEIIGQQVCVLVNLQPRPLKGIMSEGMILMAEDANGKLSFVAPVQTTSNGSTVK
jgi:methionyl-tRNA synthetase